MELRFFLINERTGEKLRIPEPVGFDAFLITVRRNVDLHGMDVVYNDNYLSFEGLGKEMALSEYNLFGINAVIRFLTEYRCGGVWETFYSGVLAFRTIQIETGEVCFAKVCVNEAEFRRIVLSRSETKVDIESLESFDGTQMQKYDNLGKEVEVPSKTVIMTNQSELKNAAFWELKTGGSNYTNHGSVNINLKIPFGEVIINEIETFDSNVSFQETEAMLLDKNQSMIFRNDDPFTYIFQIDFNIKISVTLPFSLSGTKIRVSIGRYYNNMFGNIVNGDIITTSNKIEVFQFSMEGIEIPKGAMILASINIIVPAGSSFVYSANCSVLEGAYMKIKGLSKSPVTKSKTYLIHEMLSRITESITDGCLTVKSDYYGRTDSEVNPTTEDGNGSLRCFTNGYLLRRALFEDGTVPKFTVTLKDIMDGLNAIDNIGFGIEGDYLRVELMKYFYQEKVIIKFKDVDNITRMIMDDEHFGNANIGYEKWEAEQWNGIDGFHGKRQYRTGLLRSHTFEKYCKFIADSYAIEATRRRQLKDQSKDWRYDNDTFIFDMCRQSNSIVVTQGDHGVGVPNTLIDPASVMNANLSPARNAARWLHTIMRGSTPTLGYKMTYTGSEGYSGAITNIDNKGKNPIILGNVAENQDITSDDISVADLRYPKFKPMTAEFKYPLTIREFMIIKENLYGMIQFTQGENIEYGWIKEMEYKILEGTAWFLLYLKNDN